MISRTAQYAVRAALWLAANAGRPRTAAQVAGGARVPAGYTSKVLQALGRAGLVSAQPGPGGGFTLRQPAEQIALLRVIEAVEPLRRGAGGRRPGHGAVDLCPLHARLAGAFDALEAVLSRCTLGDLLGEFAGGVCRCDESNGGGATRAEATPRLRDRWAPAAVESRGDDASPALATRESSSGAARRLHRPE